MVTLEKVPEWSEWSNWGACVDSKSLEPIKCKDRGLSPNDWEVTRWRKSVKYRTRECLTGLDCIGDWREVSKCEKIDFKNADIRQCPCDYSDRIIPHEEIISGKSLRF